MSECDAIYNIGVVSRMTGIPAATLRIWERRYAFPASARTEGKHRLYSEQEIERLRWVKARTDEGMQVRQAIRALEAREAEQLQWGDSHRSDLIPLDSRLATGISPAQVEIDHRYIEVLQSRALESLLQHKLDKVDAIFDEAMAHYTPEDILLHMIAPTLSSIGAGWEQGSIRVATEHLASHYLRQRILLWMRSGPPLFTTQATVLACAPGEYHEGGLMIFGALLRRRRWPVAYLGQSIPLQDVAQYAAEIQALAVVFSASSEESANALAEWPRAMPEAANIGRPIVGYGGRIFCVQPEWRAKMRGLYLGDTLAEGVETLERLLFSSVRQPG